MVNTVILSLNTVMSSRMSYLYSCGKTEEIKEKLKISLNFTMILGIPIMFGVAGIAANFVPLFFGNGYEKTVLLIWICSPMVVLTAISNLIGHQYLIPSGQRARSSQAVIASAAVNFALNLFMIPRLESIGASIASVIAELLVAIMYIYMSGEFLTWRMVGKSAGCRLAAGVVMLGAVLLMGRCGLHGILLVALQVIVGVLVYGIILLLIKDKFLQYCLQYGWKHVKQKIKKA
jgi:O-antigen/teichoic acid export membrane protein